MSRVIHRHWPGNPDAPSRRGRVTCDYDIYCPDLLTGRHFTLEGDVAADVVDAETAIARLNAQASALADTEALARLLLRAESVASSRIEGLEIGARRLLRAEAARGLGEPTRDVTAAEVLGNIDAMSAAISEIEPGGLISVDTLLAFHRRLLENTWQSRYAGKLREKQNWIGGSEYNPCSAVFVPPPHELIPELVEDLCAFCNTESLPAVAQAAIAHAQFETIHPFADGNGRTGRALIQLVLRRRGLATRVPPPISLVLATWAKDYVDGLTATRYRGPATGKDAQAGLNLWVGGSPAPASAQFTTRPPLKSASGRSKRNGACGWARPLDSAHGLFIELAPRSTGPHGRRSRHAGWPQLSADRRRHRASPGRRDPDPGHGGPQEPRLRSPGDHQRVLPTSNASSPALTETPSLQRSHDLYYPKAILRFRLTR